MGNELSSVASSAQQVESAIIPLTGKQVKARLDMLVDCMKSSMKEGEDFGKIPGCGDKPTLLKPGAEKIATMFRLAPQVHAEDCGLPDEIRYRVTVNLLDPVGRMAGAGIGEASSSEERYAWRAVVCKEEWDATPEDRRRVKWKRDQQGNYSIQQVRTHPPDCANTILKMAKKRALVDAILTCTAASSLFTQDIEDIENNAPEGPAQARPAQARPAQARPAQARPAQARPAQAPPTQAPTTQAPVGNFALISEPQCKRFFAIYTNAGLSNDAVKGYLKQKYGFEHLKDIPRYLYDELCAWAARGGVDEPPPNEPGDEPPPNEPGSDG